MSIESQVREFAEIAENPKAQLGKFKAAGKKVIGVMPYYVPEELVYASGMVPMGVWGSNSKNIARAKEYCASFYCTVAQLTLEMLLDGTLNGLDGIITPTICDTLRPMSQNIRVAMGSRMPVIFLAHPQNRFDDFGIEFTMSQYKEIKRQLEKICSRAITPEKLEEAIKVYNRSRAARREFVKLAGEHPEAISAVDRMHVLKAAYFMLKDEYTEKLTELNKELSTLPESSWDGSKVVVSGIIADNPDLLRIFDENHIAVAADDLAYESRSFRTDAPETDDPMHDLAQQFANDDFDVLLYDRFSNKNRRAEHVADLVKESGAQGLVLFMQQFCDPEEMEYPYLKKALDEKGIPHIKLGIDHQMRDFGQARTAIQAFSDVLSL